MVHVQTEDYPAGPSKMTRLTCRDTFVLKKKKLGDNYFSLIFGPFPGIAGFRPGHFIQLQLPGSDLFFRRPMSVADIDPNNKEMEIIFRVVGRGTTAMSRLRTGDRVSILGPLGTPFRIPPLNSEVALVAGGVGLPPLLFLARLMIARRFDPSQITFYYGGRTAGDIIMRRWIKSLGVRFCPVTEDGSFGTKGLVTEPLIARLLSVPCNSLWLFGCGPEGMLKAINDLGLKYGVRGQLSLEAPMPCGVGICLGCVVPLVKGGHARVCVEGPVFEIGDVSL